MDPFTTIYEKYKAEPIQQFANTIMVVLLFLLVAWLWALYALIKYWSEIPLLAKVVAIICLCTFSIGGPIISLIVIYASK